MERRRRRANDQELAYRAIIPAEVAECVDFDALRKMRAARLLDRERDVLFINVLAPTTESELGEGIGDYLIRRCPGCIVGAPPAAEKFIAELDALARRLDPVAGEGASAEDDECSDAYHGGVDPLIDQAEELMSSGDRARVAELRRVSPTRDICEVCVCIPSAGSTGVSQDAQDTVYWRRVIGPRGRIEEVVEAVNRVLDEVDPDGAIRGARVEHMEHQGT